MQILYNQKTGSGKREAFLLLHNIRSTHNVGSLFRTADAAGISRIFLTGYTPTPLDRFNRPVKELVKVALGAEQSIAWEYSKNPITVITGLKKSNKNLKIISIEQNKKAQDYKKIKIGKTKPVLFVIGNEVEGVSKNILKLSDVIAEIPMKGKKESLNVAVSFGIAVFRIMNI